MYAIRSYYATLAKGYTLVADATSFTLTGTDANLEFGRVLTADSATYTLTGTDANLLQDLSLTADSTTYTLSGTEATLIKGKVLIADATSYTLSGRITSYNVCYTKLLRPDWRSPRSRRSRLCVGWSWPWPAVGSAVPCRGRRSPNVLIKKIMSTR